LLEIIANDVPLRSAIIALHDPTGLRNDPRQDHIALDLLKPVADSTTWETKIFLSGVLVSVEDASPLLLFWAYQAATIYNRLIRQHDAEALAPLAKMKEKLIVMSRRWKAGGEFLLQSPRAAIILST
jgi:hypothetical protein